MSGVLESFREAVLGKTVLRAKVQRVFNGEVLVRAENVIFLELEPHRWARFFFDHDEFFCRWVGDDQVISSIAGNSRTVLVEPSWSDELCGKRIDSVQFEIEKFPVRLTLGIGDSRLELVNTVEDDQRVTVSRAPGRST